MTSSDITAALAAIDRTPHWLSRQCGCTAALVYRWTTGAAMINPAVAEWLARQVWTAARDPAPRGWQRKTGKAAPEV